jgi:hypothetical protein
MADVEGIPQREVVVMFTKQFASYFPSEVACFTPEEAQRLRDLGVAGDPPPTNPPVNVTAPFVTQAGNVLTCTMGTWNNVPTTYAYQWRRNGATNIGTNAASYTVVGADSGTTVTCVVTATNAIGSTAAPPSNGVAIA